jgi:hypothetical protein
VKQQVATEYLWAALQARRVMAEYTTHKFQHYPSIATIINYHLYRDRVPWSVVSTELQEEGGIGLGLTPETKREANLLTTAGRCGGRVGSGASIEE